MDNTSNKWQKGAMGKKFIASFSGGKDSTLALYKALQQGEAVGIVAMMEEEGQRSRAHGLSPRVLKAQAESIGLPLYCQATSWGAYEAKLMEIFKQAKADGAEVFVTGDIDVPEHECWHERVTTNARIGLGMPLWGMGHKEAVEEFINLGFVTCIVSVHLERGMNVSDLGKVMTHEYIAELETRGVDPCGESGEFHTAVIDGPLFKFPIEIEYGEVIQEGPYAFLPIDLKHKGQLALNNA